MDKSLGLRVFIASCQKVVHEGHVTWNFVFTFPIFLKLVYVLWPFLLSVF